MAKPTTYSTLIVTEGQFAGKTLAPGFANSMTDADVETWKREHGFDAHSDSGPTPRSIQCGRCNLKPCACAEIWHENDESGTYLTPNGVLHMLNEGGHNGTMIDVRTLVDWLRRNRSELLR